MSDVILVKSDFDRFSEWEDEFRKHDIQAIPWDDMAQHCETVKYALVWQPEPGALASLPNLEVIFSVGAGVDHLKGEGLVPAGIPVVRMVEDSLTAGMVEYIVYNVLRFHREMPVYERDQANQIWKPRVQQSAWGRTAGILGLGVLGSAAAAALRRLKFNVIGWSRTEKQVRGVTSYVGQNQLGIFLQKTEFLVILLPLTDATHGIVNQTLLQQLPRGAFVINAGRGPLVRDQDLLAALDQGQVAAAALDVFNQEPLPPQSPYWKHPAVTITPHVASITLPVTSAHHVADNIQRHREGKPLTHLADLSRGY
ncbi:MAG: glyoxylate/hydroxypyruvate reductase A [Arenicellales bacterium]